MPRWFDIDPQPNANAVKAWRRERLRLARKPAVFDRLAYLTELARGKNVLDVGMVDHQADHAANDDWLHKHLAAAAQTCLGVDILEEDLKKIAARGYNVRCCDITDPNVYQSITDRYDLIVAGELIEHLGQPANLFLAAKHLLAPHGRLVLTTPYPFSIWTVYRHLRGREHDNVDHVLFAFPSGMAELAERAGLQLDCYRGTHLPGGAGNHKFAYNLRRLLRPFLVEQALCTSIIYEFTGEVT